MDAHLGADQAVTEYCLVCSVAAAMMRVSSITFHHVNFSSHPLLSLVPALRFVRSFAVLFKFHVYRFNYLHNDVDF